MSRTSLSNSGSMNRSSRLRRAAGVSTMVSVMASQSTAAGVACSDFGSARNFPLALPKRLSAYGMAMCSGNETFE